ncbi:hypothetical protein V6D94_26360, partial [Serratia marcescens]|uniref:hypothetical protein n=4 Tax=Enterobacterales TaxID=91347 RepID=UPI001E2BD8E7
RVAALRTFEKTALLGGFFVYSAKRLRFSMNDLKKIRLKKRVLWGDKVRLAQSLWITARFRKPCKNACN